MVKKIHFKALSMEFLAVMIIIVITIIVMTKKIQIVIIINLITNSLFVIRNLTLVLATLQMVQL